MADTELVELILSARTTPEQPIRAHAVADALLANPEVVLRALGGVVGATERRDGKDGQPLWRVPMAEPVGVTSPADPTYLNDTWRCVNHDRPSDGYGPCDAEFKHGTNCHLQRGPIDSALSVRLAPGELFSNWPEST